MTGNTEEELIRKIRFAAKRVEMNRNPKKDRQLKYELYILIKKLEAFRAKNQAQNTGPIPNPLTGENKNDTSKVDQSTQN